MRLLSVNGARSSQNEERRALGICRVIMNKDWRRGKLGGEMAANILTSSAKPIEAGNEAANSTGSFMDLQQNWQRPRKLEMHERWGKRPLG
jgi:hypothetical protein